VKEEQDMMETIVCPYCECKIRMIDVDNEGGVCPECGALITGSLLMNHDDELDGATAEGDDFGLENDNDLDDLDDLEHHHRRR